MLSVRAGEFCLALLRVASLLLPPSSPFTHAMPAWPAVRAVIPYLMASIYRTTFVAVSVSVWLLVPGCQIPFFRHALPTADKLVQQTVTAEVSGEIQPNTSTAPITHEQAMAQVLDDLEQVRAIDAKAQKQLLADLKKTPLEDWPLVVDQFYSGLRYREQLRARSPTEPIARKMPSEKNPANEPLVQSGESIDRQRQPDIDPDVSPHSVPGIRGGLPETVLESTTVATADHPVSPPPSDITETRFAKPAGSAEILVSHTMPVATLAVKRLPEPLSVPKTDTEQSKPPKGVPWEQQLATALESFAGQVTELPGTTQDIPALAPLKLMQLAAGQPGAPLQKVPGVSPTDHNSWSRQLFALATYADPASAVASQHRATAASHQLEKVLIDLREQAALSVRNLAFCTKVYDYGAYEECTSSRFQAGKQLSLYAEVENFQSCMTDQGYFTSLASSYELLDEKGVQVGHGEFPSVEDYCRNRRRDFHIEYGLSLPGQIAAGNYRLQMTIKDNLSRKTGLNVIEFEVAGHQAE